ncbi:MAG: hypothetical protein GY863_13180, partial [bacterium]|nr:hypothetical protein [bacterium]
MYTLLAGSYSASFKLQPQILLEMTTIDNLKKARELKAKGDNEGAQKYAAEDCRVKLSTGKIKEALAVKQEFQIKTEDISKTLSKRIEYLVKREKFSLAGSIVKQFKLPPDYY